jgi:NADPH:quinone reductase-like Zn-dependent oxidoreductase
MAVCRTANLKLVMAIGADAAIVYTKEDFSRAGQIYDTIQDTLGKNGFWRSRRALKRGGGFLDAGPGPAPLFAALWTKLTGAGRVIGTVAPGRRRSARFPGRTCRTTDIRTRH